MFYIKYYWILYIYCTSAGIFSLFLFIHKQCADTKDWSIHDLEDISYKEYDFIVVGGGSAGSLVAARLAKDKKSEILLLEAGGRPSSLHDIPLIAPMLQRTHCDWQYETVPQKNACLALHKRVSRWPMGKILGGTSRLNYMIYLRGHPRDFDSWPGWSWPDILYYFKRSEQHIGRFATDKRAHGDSGPMYVSDIPSPTQLSDLLLEAASANGFISDADLNSFIPPKGSLMQTQVTGKDGSRWSTDQVLKQLGDNIEILTNSVVEKVLLRKGFEAYGVLFRRKGVQGKALARKGVILSAGVIGTPKILMLSGIGQPDLLRSLNNIFSLSYFLRLEMEYPGGKNQHFRHLLFFAFHHGQKAAEAARDICNVYGEGVNEIKPKVALPVGENLQDHVTTGLDLVLLNESLPMSWKSILNSVQNTYEYIVHGTGILTHPGTDIIGLFHTEKGATPDVQIMALPAGVSTDAGVVLAPAMGISTNAWTNYFSHLTGEQVVTILPVLLHPRSRGTVRLRSSHPDDPPIIDPQYLSHPEDVKTLIRGIRLVEKLVKRMAGASFNNRTMPGCEWAAFGSDAYWECYVRHLTLTCYHPCGTAAIGMVVDSSLRVYNTSQLYVVDGSVMPSLTSGNINAVVMMIAEKGADLIKEAVATSRSTCLKQHLFLPPRVSTPS